MTNNEGKQDTDFYVCWLLLYCDVNSSQSQLVLFCTTKLINFSSDKNMIKQIIVFTLLKACKLCIEKQQYRVGSI